MLLIGLSWQVNRKAKTAKTVFRIYNYDGVNATQQEESMIQLM